jgi:hypothetical protein
MSRLGAFAAVLALAGCRTSSELTRPRLDIGLVRMEAQGGEAGFRGPGIGIEQPAGGAKITEEHILEALREMGPLEGPVRIAVIEIRTEGGDYRPLSVEPGRLDAFRAAVGGAADSVQTVPQMFLPQRADLPAMRYAAARIGANAVFIFGRGAESDTYYNGWSKLNWLILPIFVVPGKTVEVYAAAEGALVDVRTSRVRAVALADSRVTECLATSSGTAHTRKDLHGEADLEALRQLGDALGKEVGSLKVGRK